MMYTPLIEAFEKLRQADLYEFKASLDDSENQWSSEYQDRPCPPTYLCILFIANFYFLMLKSYPTKGLERWFSDRVCWLLFHRTWFDSQHSHASSQPSITPVLGTPPSGLHE